MILTNVGLPVSPDFQKESSKRFPIYRPVPFLQIQAGKLPTALNHSAASQTSSSYRTQCADTNGTPELNCEWGPHTKINHHQRRRVHWGCDIDHSPQKHLRGPQSLRRLRLRSTLTRDGFLQRTKHREKKKEGKEKPSREETTVPRSILSLAFQKALRVFGSEKLLGLLEMKHIGLNSQFC